MALKSLGLFGIALVLGASVACAHVSERLIRGENGQSVTLSEALSEVRAGDVVVIGEVHGQAVCQRQQLDVMRELRRKGLKVSVGMEFLEYPFQSQTDLFRSEKLSEPDFLEAVGWGGTPFSLYRDQILFPSSAEGATTFALNAPRSLTGKVAKQGLDSLTTDERALLPPNLQRGRARYFERFKEAVGGHLPNPETAERYFWAQSIWDETMAWNSLKGMSRLESPVLVIVVGEFHVQYGGGLPDRLRARGAQKVWSISQVDLSGLSQEEQDVELKPSPVDGPRADWIWSFGETSR